MIFVGVIAGLALAAGTVLVVCILGQLFLERTEGIRFSFAIWMAFALCGLAPLLFAGLMAAFTVGATVAGVLP